MEVNQTHRIKNIQQQWCALHTDICKSGIIAHATAATKILRITMSRAPIWKPSNSHYVENESSHVLLIKCVQKGTTWRLFVVEWPSKLFSGHIRMVSACDHELGQSFVVVSFKHILGHIRMMSACDHELGQSFLCVFFNIS